MNKNNSYSQTITKNITSAEEVMIDDCDFPIKDVIESSYYICIDSSKVILSCDGYKLLVKGRRFIKILYTTCDCEGKVYSYTMVLPFLEDLAIQPCTSIKNINIEVNYCNIEVCKKFLWLYSSACIKVDYCFKPNCCCTPKILCCEKDKCEESFKNDCYPDHKKYNDCISKRKKTHTKRNKGQKFRSKSPCKDMLIYDSDISVDNIDILGNDFDNFDLDENSNFYIDYPDTDDLDKM